MRFDTRPRAGALLRRSLAVRCLRPHYRSVPRPDRVWTRLWARVLRRRPAAVRLRARALVLAWPNLLCSQRESEQCRDLRDRGVRAASAECYQMTLCESHRKQALRRVRRDSTRSLLRGIAPDPPYPISLRTRTPY